MTIVSKHDRVFQASFLDKRVARDFFVQHLPPKVLKHINLDILEPCPTTFITKTLGLSQSDVLYKTQINGKLGYLYLLCEHQSKSDELMPFRILQYNVGIWTNHLKQTKEKKLPLIVNVVFYNGRSPYTHSTDIRDIIDAPSDLVNLVWNQPFQLIEVNKIPDEELLKHKWAGIVEFFMKHSLKRDFLPRLKQVIGILHELELEGGKEYIITVLNYSMETAESQDIEEFVDIIKKGLSSDVGEKIMTITEQFMQKGREEGIEKGREEGISYERTMLSELLKCRFGEIPSESLSRLESAGPETMIAWSKRIFDAKTISDVFV